MTSGQEALELRCRLTLFANISKIAPTLTAIEAIVPGKY